MRWVWKPLAAHPLHRQGGKKDSKYSASLLRMYFYPRRKPPTLYLPGVGSQRGKVRASVESLNRSQTESLYVLGADSSLMFTVRPLLRTCSHSIGSVVSVCIVALIYVLLLDKVSPFIDHASTPQLLFLQQPTVHRAKLKGCVKMIGAVIILEKQRGNISSLMANREEHQGGISSFISGPNSLTGPLATWLKKKLPG